MQLTEVEKRIKELEEAVVELAGHIHQVCALQQTMIDVLQKRLEAAERLLAGEAKVESP